MNSHPTDHTEAILAANRLTPSQQIAGYVKLTSAFFYLSLKYAYTKDLVNIDAAVIELFACRRLLALEMSTEDRKLAYAISKNGDEKYGVAL